MLPRIPARIGLALVGLMFLLPSLNPYHFFPLTNFYTEWLALALGLSALVPLLAKRFWEQVEIPHLTLWLLAFAAWLLLQLVLLDIAYPELSLLGSLYIVWAAWLVWLGKVLSQSCGMERLVRWLAAVLLLGGLLNAAAAVAQFYSIDLGLGFIVASLGSVQRGAWGNFGQNNHFADYLTLALISVLYLRIKSELGSVATAACIAMLMYGLSLSGSRSVWLYLILVLVLTLLFQRKSKSLELRRAVFALALLLPVFALMQYAISYFGLALRPVATGALYAAVTPIDRLVEEAAQGLSSTAVGSGLATRIYMWHQALLMWSRAPWMGVGFGQYAGVFFQQAAELSAYHIPLFDRNAHNALMQLLAETGLVGAALVTAGLLAWARGLRMHRVSNPEAWWNLALLLVLFVHSMVEYPLWHANFLGLAAILLGMSNETCLRLRLSALTRFSFPVLLLAGAFSLGSVLNAYRDLEQLMYPRVLPKNQQEVLARNEGLLKLHSDTLLAPYVEMTYAGTIVADRGNLADKLALNSRVLRLMPAPELAYRQILLLALAGEREAASLQLRRAAAVYPLRLQGFTAEVVGLARKEPETFGPIAAESREMLKQVDRNVR